MPHRFKIVAAKDNQFRVQFVYNAEIIFWTENYASRSSAQGAIDSIKKNAPAATIADLDKGDEAKGYRFEIVTAKNGEPFVRFVRFVASNGETMARTETYKAKASARNACQSLQKNGPGAEVVDETKA